MIPSLGNKKIDERLSPMQLFFFEKDCLRDKNTIDFKNMVLAYVHKSKLFSIDETLGTKNNVTKTSVNKNTD